MMRIVFLVADCTVEICFFVHYKKFFFLVGYYVSLSFFVNHIFSPFFSIFPHPGFTIHVSIN